MPAAGTRHRVGDRMGSRYELVEQLAQGGMGSVWVARDQKLDRLVAVKLLLDSSLELLEDASERFEREAMVAARLRSAHVVQVHDYGAEDGVRYIVMELLEGECLAERLVRDDRLSVLDTADILEQVAKGLKVAHRAGLVHRDLKPSNIFLCRSDDAEVVKLLDFGVVKTQGRSAQPENTASGVLLGTPQYMSPEQARGLKRIDSRSDLWSVGVILYRMLTGVNPFAEDAAAVGDIVLRVCMEPIPPASHYEPSLGPQLDAFFERALERNPDKRFQSIDELAEGFFLAAGLSVTDLDLRTSADTEPPLPFDARASGPRRTHSSFPRKRSSEATTIGGTTIERRRAGRRRATLAAGALLLVLAGGLLAARVFTSPEAIDRPADAPVALATEAPVLTATPPTAVERVLAPAPSAEPSVATLPTRVDEPARPITARDPVALALSAPAPSAPTAPVVSTAVPTAPTPKAKPSAEDGEEPPQWFRKKKP